MLDEVNTVNEWIWSLHFKFILTEVSGIFSIAITSIALSRFIDGHFNPDHVFHPLKIM